MRYVPKCHSVAAGMLADPAKGGVTSAGDDVQAGLLPLVDGLDGWMAPNRAESGQLAARGSGV